jgi:hypothetical protein
MSNGSRPYPSGIKTNFPPSPGCTVQYMMRTSAGCKRFFHQVIEVEFRTQASQSLDYGAPVCMVVEAVYNFFWQQLNIVIVPGFFIV